MVEQNAPKDTPTREARYAEAVYDVAVDHHMWIDSDGAPLDYSPEREARISEFVDEATRAVIAVADEEQAELRRQVEAVKALAEKWWNEAEYGEDERYGRIIARTLRSCAYEVHALFGGCCTACKGEGYGYGGEPCWDCRGTGHPHPLASDSDY